MDHTPHNTLKPLKDKNGLTEEQFLASYKPGNYERPSVAADMVIFTVTDAEEENYRKLAEKELRILLIRRGGHPYLGCWALPGGFCRPGESIQETLYAPPRQRNRRPPGSCGRRPAFPKFIWNSSTPSASRTEIPEPGL